MGDPYKITGPAQICFSGGRTSGYMLRQILDANGGLPSDCHVTFQNTGKEREETLVFIQECSDRWGVPITWLEWNGFIPPGRSRPLFKTVTFEMASRAGEPFSAMVEALGMLPNPVMRLCTANLKVKTGAAYMRALGYDEWDNVMGIRADEPRRVSRLRTPGRDNGGGTPVLPLADASITKADVLAFWKGQPFDLQLDPQSDLGNCDLCYLKSRQKIQAQVKAEPWRADWWAAEEAKRAATFRRDRPTYAEIKEIAIYSQGQAEMFDDEALIDCMCGD
ncbi:hypothetical protein [Bordetella genomosp. 11]|uniref:Nin-like protein n=1 Tax=Bordetella genomosp. 11 TaxID=1416808 RepID=A0A261UJZ8_9BORD|nr:hypothetical protein [Bordetella genomosp. 11]OZI61590.1 hypothetical protein CAL28_20115 [Bordetella genomosp. 11]